MNKFFWFFRVYFYVVILGLVLIGVFGMGLMLLINVIVIKKRNCILNFEFKDKYRKKVYRIFVVLK